ncbi:metal-binding protein [Streptomyces sp. CBMA123]|uniref:metal-binding protein n=1 Tax=Streptomyces sp. CBMA123 TaxID=1896313 RepID=UPI001661BD5C|nr:metal-binding protein [Streptomyces sp. CBMA123]MBD0695501.1 metal-binding protein [Streptomyces sp. CBMA123]
MTTPDSTAASRTYRLIGPDGHPRTGSRPGTLGGHRRARSYGRLDCPSARRALAAGHDVRRRVFFADEPTALAAGHRPCAVCLPTAYLRWKAQQQEQQP